MNKCDVPSSCFIHVMLYLHGGNTGIEIQTLLRNGVEVSTLKKVFSIIQI